MLWEKYSATQKEGWAETGGLRGLESPAWKVQALSPRLGAEIPPTKSKSYKCCKLFNYLCKAPLLCTTAWYGFGHWRSHFEGLMWSDVVVLFEPFVDDGLRLLEG